MYLKIFKFKKNTNEREKLERLFINIKLGYRNVFI